MCGLLGWSRRDLNVSTWRELNWAWEAVTEKRFDDLSLLRFEIQKLFCGVLASGGVRVEFPSLATINPLKEENG